MCIITLQKILLTCIWTITKIVGVIKDFELAAIQMNLLVWKLYYNSNVRSPFQSPWSILKKILKG